MNTDPIALTWEFLSASPLDKHELATLEIDGLSRSQIVSACEWLAANSTLVRIARKHVCLTDDGRSVGGSTFYSGETVTICETDLGQPLEGLACERTADPSKTVEVNEDADRLARKFKLPVIPASAFSVSLWPLPTVLLMGVESWSAEVQRWDAAYNECSTCGKLPLPPGYYCLSCDAWGNDIAWHAMRAEMDREEAAARERQAKAKGLAMRVGKRKKGKVK